MSLRAQRASDGTGGVMHGTIRIEPTPWIAGETSLWQDREQMFLSLEEVAAYCGVPRFEVRNWIEAGRLRGTLQEDGRYRVRSQDFLMLLYRMMAAKERLRD
jgi:excisionase family DNA binding protein